MFSWIGAKMQSYLGKKVGFEPGIDMKNAIIAGKKVNAKIALIDQRIDITMRKISKIPLKEKFKLVLFILFSPFSRKNRKLLKKIDLRKVPEEKVVEALINDFKKKLPYMHKVLVEDRNKILAKNLLSIQKQYPRAHIISVIGAGHKSRVEELMKH
jgi:pheromone shutdown protein TraB